MFSNTYIGDKQSIRHFIDNYAVQGRYFDKRNRNSLKLFKLGDQTINVKSFKKPNLINSFIYRFFRESKAQRSFNYAHKLLDKGIGTPQPIAYFEERTSLGFTHSYYVSEHLHYDLTYRELVRNSKYFGDEQLLVAFGKFTYDLHSQGIQFLDHSVGNTLIIIENEKYHFYLVDLNRMKFGTMDFDTRMKNFERLSKYESHIRYMARGYVQASREDEEKVFQAMHKFVTAFQEKFYRKKRWKKRLGL